MKRRNSSGGAKAGRDPAPGPEESGHAHASADAPAQGAAEDHDHANDHAHAHGHDHDHVEQARELLRARGLRMTAPRLAVLTALLDKHRPTTAQELITAVEARSKKAGSQIDQVTVYRTLNTLVDEGIAQAVGTTDRGRRFEVHACEGCRVDHPHLQCRQCGTLECMEQGLLPALLVPTEVGGFLVDEAKLYLYGVCASCRKAR